MTNREDRAAGAEGMNLRAEIKDGTMTVNLCDLFQSLDLESKKEITKVLAWDKEIFDYCVTLLTEEYARPWYNSMIFDARKRLMENLDEPTKQLVRGLIDQSENDRTEKERMSDWAWKLFHAWPEQFRNMKPAIPDFIPHGWTEMNKAAEIIAEARSKK